MTATCVILRNPIDAQTSDLLCRLGCAADEKGIDLLLVGAFAREVLFYHMHGIETGIRTMDTDFSVRVADWDSFYRLRSVLERKHFRLKDDLVEKIVDEKSGGEVDLIPFGAVAGADARLTWPNDGPVWNVLGFEEALEHALHVSVRTKTDKISSFSVVGIESLAMLKIISFYDRPDVRKRDVRDLGFVIRHYLEAGNRARLLEQPELVERAAQYPDMAAAVLLGRDIRRVASERTRAFLLERLGRETTSSSRCFLAQRLASNCCNGNFSVARGLLSALKEGLETA